MRVSAFSIRVDPAMPGPNEIVYSTVLTTGGSRDGTIERGGTVWFYRPEHRGDEWILVSGGSDP